MLYQDFNTNFQKIDKIGEGSYGEVYLCLKKSSPSHGTNQNLNENNHPNVLSIDQSLQKKSFPHHEPSYYALKKLKMRSNKPYSYSSQESTPKVQDLRQVQIMKCLNHENLMRFQNIVFQDKGYTQNYYLVFPYGIEVLQFAKHKEVMLTKSLRKTVFYQIVKGLNEIHSQGILHRDVKPDNIFLMKSGLIKIGDFSLSRHKLKKKENQSMIQESQEEQKLSGNVTTRYYRAPEIMYGSRHYDEKIDIWSLGCTLAELILHQPIFPGQTDINQLQLIFRAVGYPHKYWPGAAQLPFYLEFVQQQEETRLENMLPDVEPQLIDMIDKCLQLDPAKRSTTFELLKHKYFENVIEKSQELSKLATYLHDKKIKQITKKLH